MEVWGSYPLGGDSFLNPYYQNHAIENHPLSVVLFNNISKFEEEWTDPLTIKQENNPDIDENLTKEWQACLDFSVSQLGLVTRHEELMKSNGPI